jgi:CHAT domain-containing protein
MGRAMLSHFLRHLAYSALALLAYVTIGANEAPARDEAPAFVAPPRTIDDITAILDQEKPDPAKIEARKRVAEAQPSASLAGLDLAKFYAQRSDAASTLGRVTQALADMRQAVELAKQHQNEAFDVYIDYLSRMRSVLSRTGDVAGATQNARDLIAQTEGQGRIVVRTATAYQTLVTDLAQSGDLAGAQATQQKLQQVAATLNGRSVTMPARSGIAWTVDRTQGKVAYYSGRFADAETAYRRAILDADQQSAAFAGNNDFQAQNWAAAASYSRADLANALWAESRLIEAEIVARQALLNELKAHGRYAVETVDMIKELAGVLTGEGRFKEAEQLDRIALDTYSGLGIDPSTRMLNSARATLAAALAGEARWPEAMQIYDSIQKSLANDPGNAHSLLGGNVPFFMSSIHAGRGAQIVDQARQAMADAERKYGTTNFYWAIAAGLYAEALAASGNTAAARETYAKAMPVLLTGTVASDASNDDAGAGRFDRWRRFVLDGYVGVLAKDGSPAAAVEAFRIADVARGQTVQRAVAAAAARASARDPALADLVRREQDGERQINALTTLLANGYALPTGQRDDAALANLRAQIDQQTAGRKAMRAEIERKFPEYVRLTNPPPATVAEAQAALQAGEALIAIYTSTDRVYLWAVPKEGAPVFAASSLSREQIGTAVKTLRKALDTDAATAGEIPAFDVATAYRLYAGLLDPIKAGWSGAKTLLVVANGTISQLPLGLLVSQNMKLAPDQPGQPLFTGYRDVPWLLRQVAVTQLPSVTSLTTLRALPAAKGQSKPFIGFGDPWFSQKEAAQAIREQGAMLAMQMAGGGIIDMRKAPVHLRSAPKTEGVDAAELGMLPRLPDTADEVTDVAVALKADPGKDVYLGPQANEQNVRTLKLDDRRVIMFATHGLVPGDLDGLTEPALALSAPDVAKVSGDGLLTVSKILGLRLNAEWVVLSACNTAAGDGAGAEAVSGLGLAFFYAGSRALLVSNWPVETVSARLLTTEVFRREAATPGLARAEALRQAMLALIDGPGDIDQRTGKPVYSYAHPIFWAPFSLVGDGGAG